MAPVSHPPAPIRFKIPGHVAPDPDEEDARTDYPFPPPAVPAEEVRTIPVAPAPAEAQRPWYQEPGLMVALAVPVGLVAIALARRR